MRCGSVFLAPCLGIWLAAVALPAIAGPAAEADGSCTLDRTTGTTIEPFPLLDHAYGTRWNAATDRLAFVQPDDKGYYHLFTMHADGNDRRALTGAAVFASSKHQGAAYWHPSGRYLLFTAEKPDWSGRRLFGVPDYEALPGFGRHDDLWLANADGSRVWQLTHEANKKDEGVLIPVFSPDGARIAWSSRQSGGTYALKVADFIATPEPHLGEVRTYRPGGAAYYETGSFTSDGKSLLYASDQDTHSFWRSQLYRLDLATGEADRLTHGDYNEHPTVVKTPAGDWVVYMSTKGVDRFPWHLMLGTDWYAMRTDGSMPKRLTTMNVNTRDNPENTGRMQVAGTVAISPSGTFMLGDVQDSLVKQSGSTKMVRFVCR